MKLTKRGFFKGLLGALPFMAASSGAVAGSTEATAPALRPITKANPYSQNDQSAHQGTMTLPEMAKFVRLDPTAEHRALCIDHLATADLMKVLPFLTIPGATYGYEQASSNAFQVDRLRIAGGDVDVENAMIYSHGPNIRPALERQKLKMLGRYNASMLINGDSELDPRFYDGLNKRIDSKMLIPAGKARGGNYLRLSKLDQAIAAVNNPTHLLMSKRMRNRLAAGLTRSMIWDKDAFGQRIAFYTTQDGKITLPILTTDYDDQNSQVIDFNETCPGGGEKVGSSIYVLNLSVDGVLGIQNSIPRVRDFGEIVAAPVHRTRVEWLYSLTFQDSRAAARLWGIKNGQVYA